MEHYFAPAPATRSRPRVISTRLRGREWTFRTDRGVFAPAGIDAGTRLLAEALVLHPSDHVLDVGCGYGVLGLVAATLVPEGRVVMVDINERAVALARQNAALAGLTNVEVLRGDGTAPVQDRLFDVAVSNPPIRAGKATVLRLVREVHDRLRPGGTFYFVVRTAQGAKTLARDVATVFAEVREVERGGGYRVFLAIRA